MSTFNRAGTLARAVESVLAQEDASLQLLIVDDHSSDGTAELLGRWQDDGRVVTVRNTQNLGLPASLNRAAALSRGEFLARLDDDDYWTDTRKLSKQLAWMDSRPDGVLLGTAYVDEQGRASENPLTDEAIRGQLLFRCPFCHSSVLMRRAAFEAVAGYDESLPYAEDWDLWLRLGAQGAMGNLDAVTLVKEPGDNTMSRRFFHRQLAMAQGFAERYGADYPGARRAAALHRFNRLFFSIVPVNSALHRGMGKAFRKAFQLESADRNGKA
jgi:glycosyltransferase involved in cell wall biosynthesis